MEERELWGDKLVTLALASGKELVRGGGGVRGGYRSRESRLDVWVWKRGCV